MKTSKNKSSEPRISFFKENCFIISGKKKIYFNEIISSNAFKNIYSKEKVKARFWKTINVSAERPYFNIPSSIGKENRIKPNSVLILRITNKEITYELISKVYMWGRINIPRDIISTLKISNKEEILIEIVDKPTKEPHTTAYNGISLSSLLKNKRSTILLKRENNFVTVYSNGKFPITLPENIPFNSELVDCFFLFHGDGHYKYKLFFSNKEPELHQRIMAFFCKYLRIPASAWKARINLNQSYGGDLAKKYWLNKLGLNPHQLYSLSKTKFNTSPEGDLRIIIDYPIVSEVFRNIFNFIKEQLDQELSFSALNGLLAAEGGAQISSRGLHRITLSYNSKEKELFIKILKNCGLFQLFKDNPRKGHGIFVLEGWEKLYLFFREFLIRDLIPFNLHTKRKQKAITGMLDHSFTKTMYKYLSILSKDKRLTIKEFSEKLNIREDSCLRTLRKKQYLWFINIGGLGIKKKPFKISITENGKELLKTVYLLRGETYAMNKQIFVKKKAEANFGEFPAERTTKELIQYGIVNIDKPKGPTEALLPEFPIRFQTMSKRY